MLAGLYHLITNQLLCRLSHAGKSTETLDTRGLSGRQGQKVNWAILGIIRPYGSQGRGFDRTALACHAFAAPAGVLVAHVAQDLDLGRHDVELLADLRANAGQNAAAGAGLLGLGQVVDHLHPGQVGGDGLAAALAPGMGRDEELLEGRGRLLRIGLLGLVEKPVLILAGIGFFSDFGP